MRSIRRSHGIGNIFRRRLPALALLLALCAWAAPAGSATRVAADKTAASKAGETCPLTTPVFQARLNAKTYSAAVGSPAHLRVLLTPRTVPQGFFVTCIIDVISAPPGQKPIILTGHPVSDVTPREPGTYRLRALVNLIAKSSCNGVKAVTLLDQEVVLIAR